MNPIKLYSVAFLAKTVQSSMHNGGAKVTATVEFMQFDEQSIFEPFALREDGSTVDLYAGKSFTFGLSRCEAAVLAKRFVVCVRLWQTDPDVQLFAPVDLDASKTFARALDSLVTQEQTDLVRFSDEVIASDDATRAAAVVVELNVRVTPVGSNVMREFRTSDRDGEQVFSMATACRCPAVPAFRCPVEPPSRRGGDDDDAGEWDTMYADMDNGQQIAVKYKRNYCGNNPPSAPEYDRPSSADSSDADADYPATKNEEKFDGYVLSLMQQMHDIVAANVRARRATEPQSKDDDGDGDDQAPEEASSNEQKAITNDHESVRSENLESESQQ